MEREGEHDSAAPARRVAVSGRRWHLGANWFQYKLALWQGIGTDM